MSLQMIILLAGGFLGVICASAMLLRPSEDNNTNGDK